MAARPSFRCQIHLDFTHQAGHPPRGHDHIPDLLERLAEYPVVGCFHPRAIESFCAAMSCFYSDSPYKRKQSEA
jgi:hypothetical protein